MNVRELMDKLSRLNPDLPVVIEQEDLELVGQYVEVMDVRFSDDEIRYSSEDFSLDGSRPYTRPDWEFGERAKLPTEAVVMLSCQVPWKPIIDGELAQRELA